MKRVLICEDDDEIIELTAIILKLNGYDVNVIKDCSDDIAGRVYEMKPDLVLMDLWIPQIGGERAIMELKGNPFTRSIPVVVFSACNQAELVAKKVHAEGCIHKPFAINFLEDTVSHMLKRA
jgi:CheY-like chemotaxis protein